MTITTRFAPSPTGYLHIGGVRTALFCWLYARRQAGRFVLRIEDTDRARSTQAAVDAIIDGMSWAGLHWDEGPHLQSERAVRYREVAGQLLQSGDAYHCYCTPDEVDAMRERQIVAGENPRYDGRCRDRTEPRKGVEPVIRFKTPREGEVVVEDLVRGRVVVANSELDDLVIMRADGWPTYHFAVVVDDADMGITHVIRGDDHLNNTPRQIHIIRSLGYVQPSYAHLPMILGEDGAKLSKRHGAVNVLEYRDRGYLPEALLNYLVRLGWSHGDQEIFSIDEMIRLFDIGDVNASASRFSLEKLNWMNQQYIQAASADRLGPLLAEQLVARGLDPANGPPAERVADAFRERAQTLSEMAESCWYLYNDFDQHEPQAAKKHLRPAIKAPLAALRDRLAQLPDWSREAIHAAVETVAGEHDTKFGKLGQPLRVAVTGSGVSPPIDVTVELVGRERGLRRLDQALEFIAARESAQR